MHGSSSLAPADSGDPISGDEVAADHMASGDLPDQPSQNRAVDLGDEVATRCELYYGLVHPSQADGCVDRPDG